MNREFEEFKQVLKARIMNALEIGVNDPELAEKMAEKGLGKTKVLNPYADIGQYKYNMMGKI